MFASWKNRSLLPHPFWHTHFIYIYIYIYIYICSCDFQFFSFPVLFWRASHSTSLLPATPFQHSKLQALFYFSLLPSFKPFTSPLDGSSLPCHVPFYLCFVFSKFDSCVILWPKDFFFFNFSVLFFIFHFLKKNKKKIKTGDCETWGCVAPLRVSILRGKRNLPPAFHAFSRK
jgi:hypothetical protein